MNTKDVASCDLRELPRDVAGDGVGGQASCGARSSRSSRMTKMAPAFVALVRVAPERPA